LLQIQIPAAYFISTLKPTPTPKAPRIYFNCGHTEHNIKKCQANGAETVKELFKQKNQNKTQTKTFVKEPQNTSVEPSTHTSTNLVPKGLVYLGRFFFFFFVKVEFISFKRYKSLLKRSDRPLTGGVPLYIIL
jgi:hypothetical protein